MNNEAAMAYIEQIIRQGPSGHPDRITPTTTIPATTKSAPTSSTAGPNCTRCGGSGWIVPDLQPKDPGFGKARRCPVCGIDYSDRCGLNEQERQYTAKSISGRGDTETALRYLVDAITAKPAGWLTLYGAYGTAKTLTVQAIIAGLVRAKKVAKFVRASEIEQAWFDDLHSDSDKRKLFLELPALAIDELDKVNLRNDWIRERFQELMDLRYRSGIAGETLTLITLQGEPSAHLPGDIASRINDGRFSRLWTGGRNSLVIDRWGEKVLPGCLHIEGADARPNMAPDFVQAKRTATHRNGAKAVAG